MRDRRIGICEELISKKDFWYNQTSLSSIAPLKYACICSLYFEIGHLVIKAKDHVEEQKDKSIFREFNRCY